VDQELGLNYHYKQGGSSPFNIVELMGAGAGFLDFDNDGWLDIVCAGMPRPALFRSEQGRRFVDVTEKSGIGRREGRWYGCASADYDNDGFVDLFLTGHNQTALFRNRGDGSFQDVTDAAGVRLQRWASSAAFADVDRDGDLDLYVGCYATFGPGSAEFLTSRGVQLSLGPDAYPAQKGVLFRNDGGRFRDVTAATGLEDVHGKALGVAFADADGDGDDDLYIANDQQPQDFMLNDGHGRFRNAALESGVAFSSEMDRQGGMGVAWGDYNGDQLLDLFVANFADEPKSLYRNAGQAIFEHAGDEAGVSQPTRPWVAFGTRFADLDADGKLDLLIVNGHVQDLVQQVDRGNSYPQRPQLFLNAGGGKFREISAQVGPDFQKELVGRALAVSDYDNDGDLDALVANLGGAPVLFRNDGGGAPGHWLMLRLIGTRGDRTAIGARVEARVGDVRQIREVRTDGSYLAANDPRVHFGLGPAARVDEITIHWPSGARSTLRDVAANQILEAREPAGASKPKPGAEQ
jgi:hypothetical protein